MPTNDQPASVPTASEWHSPRTYLAVGIPAVCIGCIFVLSFMLFHDPGDAAQYAMKKEILNLLLPLTGTWIGTILAFYFSRDTFIAANQSVRELAATVSSNASSSTTASSTLAKDRMIPLQKMEYISDTPDPDLLLAIKNVKSGDRLPILDQTSKAPRYILHGSVIDRAALSKGNAQRLLLSDLLKSPDLNALAESFGVCPETATLGEVKDTMYRITNCQDVFITKTGHKTEPVIGWVTNAILQDNLKS